MLKILDHLPEAVIWQFVLLKKFLQSLRKELVHELLNYSRFLIVCFVFVLDESNILHEISFDKSFLYDKSDFIFPIFLQYSFIDFH